MPKKKAKLKDSYKKPATAEETLCKRVKTMVDDAIGFTTTWEQNNLKWYKMRMRIKKQKNFPFVGCANIRMPTLETKIRKLKSGLTNVIYGIRPVVQVIPSPKGNWTTAMKVEKFLDHMIMDVVKAKPKSVIAIDQALEKGFYLLKPFWNTDIITRTETLDVEDLSLEEAMWFFDERRTPDEHKQAIVERLNVDMHPLVSKKNQESVEKVLSALLSGKKKIVVEFEDVLYNAPDIALAEPERTYVPTDAGYDPQTCSWIIHEFMLPIETVKMNAKYKNWSVGDITDIEEEARTKKPVTVGGTSRDKDIDSEKDIYEGISVLEKTGKIKIWEFYGWYDLKGNGVQQKCVITLAPDFDKTLRKISLPFYSGEYPFVKLFYELKDDRWFAHRGIPEMIEDIVKEIDMQHNQKLDQQTMRNSPMYVYRAGMINKNTVQFIFGQGLPAQGLQPLNDLIAPINNNNPNVEFSYEKEQMLLESKVEELLGQVDYTLQSMINKRQPRTLGEVNLQANSAQQVFSLDADMCRTAHEQLFNWIWDLWCQYGDDEYEFMYFGKEGWEPIKLSKEEIQGKYKITVRGNDQNTNPQVRIQKAQMILMAQQNQMAIQTGVITPVNIANGLKRFYQELDIPNWEELVSQPQPPKPQPNVKLDMDNMTDAEQAQVLAKQGIQPDVQGRALKSKAKIQEKGAEQEKLEAEAIEKTVRTLNTIGGTKEGGAQ